ncbi:hypothetical protein EOA13_21495 [Mesorhizobium sp. M7A.F.Ca.US.011.01.1.1]|uniref:hypothetical protein n=1 Tax=Mesorhizobium sp. M7A.F.Ca.US.011.01.1.1 TaxID=2496741 RepID=UPI000FCA4CCC|nr:hypothetical protein [Mesorhizobium sp. M7A.F.Ca.US.011.01.1.1]RUX27102.1 hypothetical protein EOA13_21495 [Mesorhizobium sp. M7A.F.Ca.US.011.01.1.1]
MTLFLHIGPPKTGTTYIQEMFVANLEVFRGPEFCYPALGRDMTVHGRYPGHHGFSLAAEKYIGDTADPDLYSKWIDILKNNKNVILSAEGMSGWNSPYIKEMQNIANAYNHNVIVIYFIREPNDLLYSQWKEEVKLGLNEELHGFLIRHLTDPKYSWRYNPLGDLIKFRFGSSELDYHIYLYDVLRRQKADIFLAMARNSFGISDLSASGSGANESHSIEVIDAMLRLNEHLSEEHGFLGGQVREAMYALQFKEMPDIYDEIVKLYAENISPKEILFSRDTYHHEMLEQEIASYDRLGKYLKTQVPEGGIFPKDPLTLHYYDRRDVWANATVSNQLRCLADRLKPYLQSAAVAPGGWLAPLKETS